MQDRDAGELLRERGLRVTPQRRAILGAFADGPTEHLSADEVHARAAALVPELGRGTVYAALAEMTELGVVAALGSPEPVRYELNTADHSHFRCRLCLRLFDVELPELSGKRLRDEGFAVERMAVVAEGVCAECVDYDDGLRAGAGGARRRPSRELPTGLAAAIVETPVGPLALGATPEGMVRVVFENHADAAALAETRRARRGGRAARAHLTAARAALDDFFEGRRVSDCAIDWGQIDGAETLRAASSIPRAREQSYDTLDTPAGARERGTVLGANPLALLVPCHRVMRGREVPRDYVGGPELRTTLLALEEAWLEKATNQ